jgi:hypothetical protein
VATPAPADTAQSAPAADTAKAVAVPDGPVTPPAVPAAPAAKEESAKDAIIENPIEFGIVSAVFLATVLLIIFTGKN